jgi:hypothetical protein
MKTVDAIRSILEHIAQPGIPSEPEYQLIMDATNQHYAVVVSGWRGMERIHGIVVQIDLRDGLVWIQVDNTDYDVAQRLVDLGVPKNRIVLGFQPPSVRQYTEYATGDSSGKSLETAAD